MAKNLLLWLLIAAVLLSVFNNFNLRTSTEQVGYSAFVNEVQIGSTLQSGRRRFDHYRSTQRWLNF